MREQYLFYVDDYDILCAIYKDGLRNDDEWQHCTLRSAQGAGIQCAPYSRLAAITVAGPTFNNIFLYYQALTEDAAVKVVWFEPATKRWNLGSSDLTEPPLFGTSITAVQPRSGISFSSVMDGLEGVV